MHSPASYRAASNGQASPRRDRSRRFFTKIRQRLAGAVTVALVVGFAIVVQTVILAPPAEARYAENGTGLYKGSIDWFEWGNNGDPIPQEGLTKTETRMVGAQELATTCTISNVSGDIVAYRSGNWRGDAFDDLYNVGGTGRSNQLIAGISGVVPRSLVSFSVDCSVTLDGNPVEIQGLVVADTEASNMARPPPNTLRRNRPKTRPGESSTGCATPDAPRLFRR